MTTLPMMLPLSIRLIGQLCRAVFVLLMLAGSSLAGAAFSVSTPAGDPLDIKEFGATNRGPLYLWLLNQYGETQRANSLASELAERGATVWQVDLLDALMLQRTAEAIRNLDGAPVAALLHEAVRRGRRPIVLVASDRMAVPLLKGMREWQTQAAESRAVAGAVLFFPNLYRGTPIAGEDPALMDIVGASNMPVLIMQPALGANRERLPDLLRSLHAAGSSAYAWLVPGVRDYYLFHTARPQSDALQALAGQVPTPVEEALRATPGRLLAAARLLAASPHPAAPRPLAGDGGQSIAPAYGLIERPRLPAPDYALRDASGQMHRQQPGRITLVNFWATWCPPCVHEIPSMNRLAASYDPKDFAIVSINFKEAAEHVQAFLKRVNVDFPVLLDQDGAVSSRWRVFAFPSSFLLDRSGTLRYSVNTAIEWDSEEVKAVIDGLLREPAKPAAK
jgi:thiol-disulfide isomerase/thioredoxin